MFTQRSIPGSVARALAALVVGAASATAAAAPVSNTSIQVISDPRTVSVSRAEGPTFYVSYKVTVTNNSSNNNYTYDFKATTKITNDSGGAVNDAYAQYFGSSGIPCKEQSQTVVTCEKLNVDKGTSKTFTLTYKTPRKGAKLQLTVESTSKALKGSGSAVTTLVTIPYTQTIVEFYTFVPREGGVFFTGTNGNLPGSPGAVAVPGDPWTTTIVIPPIPFTTTARALETQDGSLASCSSLYLAGGCFDTNLVIPSDPGALQTMTIYLRVDGTKINLLGSSIINAKIRYSKDGINFADVEDCTPTNGPQPGKPCMSNRKAYGNTSDIPAAWRLDWEFEVKAVDNGRYIN